MGDASHHKSFASVLTGVNKVLRRIFFILDNRNLFSVPTGVQYSQHFSEGSNFGPAG